MFKITIGCIPSTGLNVDTSIAVEPLNERLIDTSTTTHSTSKSKATQTHQAASNSSATATHPPIIFSADPHVKLRITATHAGAEVRGVMLLKIDQDCSRCCDPKPRELTVPIHLQLRQAPLDSSDTDEELGIIFFRDDHADIEPVLHDLALVALDIFWKPDLKADGSCSLCTLNFRGLISSDSDNHTVSAPSSQGSRDAESGSTSNPFRELLKNDLRGKL